MTSILAASASPTEIYETQARDQGFEYLSEVIKRDTKICESYRNISAPGVPTYESCLEKVIKNAEGVLACPESPRRHRETVRFDAIQIEDVFGKFQKFTPSKEVSDVFHQLVRMTEKLSPAQFASRQWKLIGYEHPIANATAAADGTIFISRAFFNYKIDEIAAVLAHEISHVAGEHSLHLGCQTLEWIGTDNTIEEASLAFREDLVDGMPRKQAWKKLSQSFEFDADFFGALLLSKAGRDPMAMVRMLEKLFSGQSGDFSSGSHPDQKERVSKLKTRIERELLN